MRSSKLGPPGNVAYVGGKRPAWEPLEAKAGPLEVMTLPTSLRLETPENYSGHGREQDGDEARSRAASGEEKEVEGSGEGANFPGGFGLKASSALRQGPVLKQGPVAEAELVTVAEHTTLSQWQLVEQPTTSTTAPQGPQEPGAAEEARGEILYIRRPVETLSSAPSKRRDGSSSPGSSPVFRCVRSSYQHCVCAGSQSSRSYLFR